MPKWKRFIDILFLVPLKLQSFLPLCHLMYEKIWLHGYIQPNDILYLVPLRLQSSLPLCHLSNSFDG